MSEGDAAIGVALGGLILGAVFGGVVQGSHFCTMGCISDAVLFGSLRRLRVWALAVAIALLGSQALAWAGLVDLAATPYRAPSLFWLGAVLGGLLFGFGMVLAGGCVGRNLVRLGGGSLKALVTLLVMAVTAEATMLGALAPVHAGLRALGSVDLGRIGAADGGAPALLSAASGLGIGFWTAILTLAVAGALLAFVLKDAGFRRARGDMAAALVLGTLVPAGWLVTGRLGADPFAPMAPESLTYVGPTAMSLRYVMIGAGEAPGFGVALVAGTILGAAAVARHRRSLRLEVFVARDDMVRHLVGGALMGCGGVLAAGCTIGQGLTGVATLSLGSWLTLAAILAGGVWGMKYLETGRLLPLPVRLPQGRGQSGSSVGLDIPPRTH